jgi:hypothetical protein
MADDSFDPRPSRFLPGVLLGLVLGAGGVFGWFKMQPPLVAPEWASMGPSTMTSGKIKKKPAKKTAVASKTPSTPNAPNTPNNNITNGDLVAPEAAPPQEEIPQITAADLKPEADGDVLRPRTLTIDAESTGPEPRDLSQSEVDSAFATVKPQIVKCIIDARGPAPVAGKITVGVVIGPEGKVFKSRVEGPAYLMDQGLYSCVKTVLSTLRFPAPGKDIVATVPFTIK